MGKGEAKRTASLSVFEISKNRKAVVLPERVDGPRVRGLVSQPKQPEQPNDEPGPSCDCPPKNTPPPTAATTAAATVTAAAAAGARVVMA